MELILSIHGGSVIVSVFHQAQGNGYIISAFFRFSPRIKPPGSFPDGLVRARGGYPRATVKIEVLEEIRRKI